MFNKRYTSSGSFPRLKKPRNSESPILSIHAIAWKGRASEPGQILITGARGNMIPGKPQIRGEVGTTRRPLMDGQVVPGLLKAGRVIDILSLRPNLALAGFPRGSQTS